MAADVPGKPVAASLRTYCRSMLQEAVRLKEKKLAEDVIAVSLGPKACQVLLA